MSPPSAILEKGVREVIMERDLLRVGEAAEILSVSRWTIYRWVEEGKLEGTKIGRGSLRVFRISLEKLIQQNRTEEWKMMV